MGLARLHSRGQSGLDAFEVMVEVHLANGLPGFAITGLPAPAVRESRDRVRAALQNTGLELPQRRITAHLGPADVPKDGGRFDLAIALGVVAAQQARGWQTDDTEFIGELALNGELRPVNGALPAVLAARERGRRIVIPMANAAEAGLIEDARSYAASSLGDVLAELDGHKTLPRVARTPLAAGVECADLSQVKGQELAKRALTIAAAGAHNMLMVGPPGSGKSMLAERLRGILPPLGFDEVLRVASIASVAGTAAVLESGLNPPFRAPHHSCSAAALVGGGPRPRPGEVSLAHLGVLFLDELPEFSRQALEALREPLESGLVRISRVREQVSFPARIQLVAAMNPCPCGYRGDGTDRCQCTEQRVRQYRGRISGPLLDRFDLHVEVPQVRFAELSTTHPPGDTAATKARVGAARQRQLERQGNVNSRLEDTALWRVADLDAQARDLLEQAATRWRLSARSTIRVLRVARSIADLDEHDRVEAQHLAEALQLRHLDRRV